MISTSLIHFGIGEYPKIRSVFMLLISVNEFEDGIKILAAERTESELFFFLS
jgi:hypothetical protein